MKLFIDMDGTIVGYRKRFYDAYATMARQHGKTPMTAHDFWKARDNERKGMAELLGMPKGTDITPAFNAIIEERERLEGDTLIATTDTLRALGKHGELVIVTVRSSRESLLWQLDHLGIGKFFAATLDTENTTDKETLIRQYGCAKGDIVVGDTESDIKAGKTLGLRTVAVASGLRTTQQLQEHHPDAVLETINDLPAYLEAHP